MPKTKEQKALYKIITEIVFKKGELTKTEKKVLRHARKAFDD